MKKWKLSFIVIMIMTFTLLWQHSVMAETGRYKITGEGSIYHTYYAQAVYDGVVAYYEEGTSEVVNVPSWLDEPVVELDGDFYKNPNLKAVTIPNPVRYIHMMAFHGCSSLESVTMADSVESIDDVAFESCHNLKNVKLSNTLSHIGFECFNNCGLKSITIPMSVEKIDYYAIGYQDANNRNGHAIVPGFTIYGYYGTVAEEYAHDNGITFIGTPTNLADYAYISPISSVKCNGKPQRPSFEIEKKWHHYMGSSYTLRKGIDYTVSYKNNVYPGTATAVIKGINHFTGSITKNFKIRGTQFKGQPKSVNAKAKKNKVTVTWKNNMGSENAKITGIQVQYSTDRSFRTNVGSKKIGKNKSEIELKLRKRKTYYVRLRYIGSDSASKWSGVKKIKTK